MNRGVTDNFNCSTYIVTSDLEGVISKVTHIGHCVIGAPLMTNLMLTVQFSCEMRRNCFSFWWWLCFYQ